MERILRYCSEALTRSQSQQSQYANKHRLPAPIMSVGDKVLVDMRHLDRNRPSKKLDHVSEGPYTITKVISPLVVSVDLPKDLGIDNRFHTSLLRHYPNDPYPSQVEQQPPPVHIAEDSQPEYEVKAVVDSRYHYRKLQYLVEWFGYSERTWEPHTHLQNSQQLVDHYHVTYPSRPGLNAVDLTVPISPHCPLHSRLVDHKPPISL